MATVVARPLDTLSGETRGFAASFAQAQRPPISVGQPAPKPEPPAAPANPSTAPTTTTPPVSSPPPAATTTTQPPVPPPPPPTSPPAPPGQIDRVVELVNKARAEEGCAPLRVDDKLTAAASAHSTDMANRNYFSHTTPEGVTFDERIKAAGNAAPGAENIAMGQKNADAVMDAWMKSKGHRANIVNCQLATIGVGLSATGFYWTQDFGY